MINAHEVVFFCLNLTVKLNHFGVRKVVFSTLTKLFFSCWAIFWPQYIHLRVYAALKVDNCPIVFFCLNLTLWNQRVCYLKFLLSFIGSIWALIWDFKFQFMCLFSTIKVDVRILKIQIFREIFSPWDHNFFDSLFVNSCV